MLLPIITNPRVLRAPIRAQKRHHVLININVPVKSLKVKMNEETKVNEEKSILTTQEPGQAKIIPIVQYLCFFDIFFMHVATVIL